MRRSGLGWIMALVAVAATSFGTAARAQVVINGPFTGSADAGIASTVIANVVAHDTVNGAKARLGKNGNLTIAESRTWPAGLKLSTTTGALTTTATLRAGVYAAPVTVCDRSTPPDCTTVRFTITVIDASVVPAPDAGTGYTGIASEPVANVTLNDTVNGAPVKLGASGNATIAALGTWPGGGLSLTPTGGVSYDGSLPAGTYAVSYNLCDKNVPPLCASTTVTITIVQVAAEVQVSTVPMVDIEYDWGRDGILCTGCNFGAGNARFNWTDKLGNLWIGHIDQGSGAFDPPTGNNELADTTAYFSGEFGNGPEWVFSTQGGQVISQLVYARYPPGLAQAPANAGTAFTTPVQGGSSPAYLPGAQPIPIGGTLTTYNPSGSQCNSDPVALTYFYDNQNPQNVYWEPVTTAPGTAPTLTPLSNYSNVHVSGGKPSIRWIACTHQLVFVGAAPPDASGNVYQQVFWYDIDTQVVQQLTFEPQNHEEAYMFKAPEFGDDYVIYTFANNLLLEVYVQTGTARNGAPMFTLANSIASPDPAEPYMQASEPFIHCTPACRSYVFMRLQSPASFSASAGSDTNGIGVAGIDPANPVFKVLIPEEATPNIQRIDLEYYITANGPYLYYSRTPITPGQPFSWGNRYYVDMGLGAPTGVCVGSSAEGGMAPGC
jgi:phage terminase large subunit-like protein